MSKIYKKGIWAILACFLSISLFSCRQESSGRQGVTEYQIMKVEPSSRTIHTYYSATIRGRQDVEIRPQISGLITDIHIREGETVRKGQILFVIDQVAYKAELETAVANVASAESHLSSAKLTTDSKRELFAQNVISEFEMLTAQNDLKIAEATLTQAKAQETNARNNLSYTEVKSPSDGVAGTLPYRIGALVNPTIPTPLTTVSDNAEMYVYFSMTENQALALIQQYGSLIKAIETMPEVELRLKDKTLYANKGKIESISGILDQRTGSVSVRAAFPNAERTLLSGSSGGLIFPYEMENCIAIPLSATFEIQDKTYVYKVVNGISQSTQIEVFPINDGREYVVESGLTAGDIIVAEGAGLLRNGVEIQVKND